MKLVIRYVDTGEELVIPKSPRPYLCARCGAFATWAMQSTVNQTIIAQDGAVRRRTVHHHEFYCAYHIKTAK